MEKPRNKLDILVVDDDPESRYLVGCYLSEQGYRLSFAESGQTALELFQTKSFDLVIVDLQMPAMDGLETTRRIRAFESVPHRDQHQGGPVPILALSANTSPDTPQQCTAAGCNGYRRKPIDACSLIRTIREIV